MTFYDWYRSKAGRAWQTEQMAAFVGCSVTTIRALARKNARRPTPEVMLGIARMTGGWVKPNDWFPELASVTRDAEKPPPVPKLRKRVRPA